jgi:glycerol-3-phosphate acyltransferase PlsX
VTRPTATVAVDAMGGDRAPGEIVAGALDAATKDDVRILLVGRREELTPLLPDPVPDRVEVVDARDVIAMDDEPVSAVRKQKDSSIVRSATAVRDGDADAMVSAGNTGAVTTAAVLRLKRFRGVPSPAIAVPIPVPGQHPQLLVDGGAVLDPPPERLVQFARMGSAYARARYGLDTPTIGLLSNGEESSKGDELRKRAHELLRDQPGFIGNVEGRDFMHAGRADVIVTDGFTGNVALKCMEGALRSLAGVVFRALDATPEARDAAAVLLPALLEAAEVYDPDVTGGAVLVGVSGVCVISHGSSSARAITNAVQVAADCVRTDVVSAMREAVRDAG